MSNNKRPRGRPRGTGKNDAPYLAQVADILVREPSLKATTAMKRIMIGSTWLETDQTLIRRWQVKWQRDKENLLAAARDRAKPRRTLRDVPPALSETANAWKRFEALSAFAQTANTWKRFEALSAFAQTANTLNAWKSFEALPAFTQTANALNAWKRFEALPAFTQTANALNAWKRLEGLPGFGETANSWKRFGALPAFTETANVLNAGKIFDHPAFAEMIKVLHPPAGMREVLKHLEPSRFGVERRRGRFDAFDSPPPLKFAL